MKLVTLKIIVFAIAFLAPIAAFAEGRANHFKVQYVRVDKNGKGYVVFYENLAQTPAGCGASHKRNLAFDTNTPGGQAIMSLALTAFTTGKRIQAYGTNNCTVYGSVESWNWGFIVPD
jgi:hypothetical protein